MNKRKTFLVLLLSFVLHLLLYGFFGAECRAQSSNGTDQSLKVTISAKKTVIRPGEKLIVRTEVLNQGSEPIYIGVELDEWGVNPKLHLSLYLQSGKLAPGLGVGTAVEYGPSGNKVQKPPLAGVFSKSWIALPPGHFYGTEVVMDPSVFRGLATPGRYTVKGTYSSAGFLYPGLGNPLRDYLDELANLPYKAWTGQIDTNSIQIEVLKRTKNGAE